YRHYIEKQLKPIADSILILLNLSFDSIVQSGQLSFFNDYQKEVQMKNLLFCLLIALISLKANQVNFNQYFLDETMRIEYHHTGDAETEIISLDRIYRYGTWAGSTTNLIDNLN